MFCFTSEFPFAIPKEMKGPMNGISAVLTMAAFCPAVLSFGEVSSESPKP